VRSVDEGNALFSVIVLSYNKARETRRCLESLLASTGDWEALAVDNGSGDDTVRFLHEMVDKYHEAGRSLDLVLNDANLGASTGRNQGIARTRGEFTVFLDNDIIVDDPDWLTKLRVAFHEDAAVGIVVPKLVFADSPGVIQCAGCAVSRTGRVQFVGRGEPADDARFAERREMQCGISACMMLKRAMIDAIGGLDEAFNPVQFEDIDYCYRARSAGYRVVYEPAVTMLHDESTTTAGTPALNNPYIVVKHGMLFKERWRHMFENEAGPTDEEARWKPIGRFEKKDDTTHGE